MRPTVRRFLGMLAIAGLLSFGTGAHAAEIVTCKDGTTVKSGRGACSHHGGRIAKVPGSAATDPAGATALCKDGRYSHAGHHQGACSHHGGVERWLR